MRPTVNQLFALYFLMAAVTAISVFSDQVATESRQMASRPDLQRSNTTTPGDDGPAISQWAMSGIVWSEASLVKRLAVKTAETRTDLSATELDQLEKIATEHQSLIDAMEQFGRKRLQEAQSAQDRAIGQPTETTATDQSDSLPDPAVVGARLAQSMGMEPEKTMNATTQNDSGRVNRYDTETPSGLSDPGIDDERSESMPRIDIDQYRVDDVVDETPAEAENLADAREDGVEKAIAAADPEGIAGPTAGRISQREVQTRSSTMAYSQDSIYDSDDYDPDADYNVDDPLTRREMKRQSSQMLDGDDDVLVRKPAIAAEGEDELLAAMRRGQTRKPGADVATPGALANQNQDRQETANEITLPSADTPWVKLHQAMDENRFQAAAKAGLSPQRVFDAANRLKITIRTLSDATDDQALSRVLRQFR